MTSIIDVGNGAPGPVFIGGPERSGKTYLRFMLAAHPNLVLTKRTNMWTTFYGRFGNLARNENLERCLQAMMKRKLIRALDPDVERIRREFRQGPRTYGRLFSLFHEHYAEREKKIRWGDQTELIEQSAGPIFSAFPQARMIQMIRDPRDRFEALCARDMRESHKIGKATAKWLYSEALGRQNHEKYPDRYMIVRYESMVANPAETMREVCRFLGEDYTAAMTALAEVPRFSRNRETSPLLGQSPLSTDFIGRYRTELSMHEIAFIQNHAGARMSTYDYAPEPIQFNFPERASFYLGTWGPNVAQMAGWRILHAVRKQFSTPGAPETGLARRLQTGQAS